MNLLIFTRPWLTGFFRDLAGRVFPDARIHWVTEFSREAAELPATYLLDGIHRFVNQTSSGNAHQDLYDEAIRRDRWLRQLPRRRAEAIVEFTARFWEETLESQRPDLILALAFDNFSGDILGRCAMRRGIPLAGFLKNFLDSRFRFTLYGEAVPLRLPVTAEERARYESLVIRSDYRPSYVIEFNPTDSRGSVLHEQLAFFKQWLFDILPARGDARYNFFRVSTPYIARKRMEYLLWDMNRLFSANWRELRRNGKPSVLIPLQFVPEQTIDYWVPLDLIPHEDVVLELAETLSRDYTVLVKEHPAMVGCRSRAFFRALRERAPGVVLVPPLAHVGDTMAHVDVIVTWTSSVGIEGVFRGKRVVTLGTPYYWIEGMGRIGSRGQIPDLPDIIANLPAPGGEMPQAMLDQLLGCTAPGKLWDRSAANLDLVGAALRAFLRSRGG